MGGFKVSCAVCHNTEDSAKLVVVLPCSHAFHDCCIFRWTRDHTGCPSCRTVIQATMELKGDLEALPTSEPVIPSSPPRKRVDRADDIQDGKDEAEHHAGESCDDHGKMISELRVTCRELKIQRDALTNEVSIKEGCLAEAEVRKTQLERELKESREAVKNAATARSKLKEELRCKEAEFATRLQEGEREIKDLNDKCERLRASLKQKGVFVTGEKTKHARVLQEEKDSHDEEKRKLEEMWSASFAESLREIEELKQENLRLRQKSMRLRPSSTTTAPSSTPVTARTSKPNMFTSDAPSQSESQQHHRIRFERPTPAQPSAKALGKRKMRYGDDDQDILEISDEPFEPLDSNRDLGEDPELRKMDRFYGDALMPPPTSSISSKRRMLDGKVAKVPPPPFLPDLENGKLVQTGERRARRLKPG